MLITHTNCLSAYLSDSQWVIDAIARAARRPSAGLGIPQPLQSLTRHEYNLCLMLGFFDDCLKRFEAKRPDFGAYSEAMAFLDVIYILSRLLLDSAAGVVRHYYKCNDNCELPKSFNGIFTKSAKGQLPDNLNAVFSGCKTWFPDLKARRDDIVHHYETYFIGFEQNSRGKMTPIQFSSRSKTRAIPNEELRAYIGGVMAGYQRFIVALLNNWDTTFKRWYGIGQTPNSRRFTILEGRSANILWWAYQYGGYRHDNLVIEFAGHP